MRYLALACLVAVGAACANASGEASLHSGPKVPTELVPSTLDKGSVVVTEDASATKEFKRTRGSTLAADAKLWALRRNDTLVASLQIATLVNKVNLRRRLERQQIVSSVLAGGTETIDVQGITVHTLVTQDRAIFLWFGGRMFEVLQVKATKQDPERLLNEILAYQGSSPAWEPLEVDEKKDES